MAFSDASWGGWGLASGEIQSISTGHESKSSRRKRGRRPSRVLEKYPQKAVVESRSGVLIEVSRRFLGLIKGKLYTHSVRRMWAGGLRRYSNIYY